MVKAVSRSFALALFLSCVAFVSTAQTQPPLERIVTIQFREVSVEKALAQLSQAASFSFSYSPAVVEGLSPVSASFVNQSVREVLDEILNGQVAYKEKGNYVILTKSASTQKKSADDALVIDGYVVHRDTREKLASVSVYDKRTLASTVTTTYGYFKLKIDKPEKENQITFSRRSFEDTVIVLAPGNSPLITVPLKPKPSAVRPAPLSDLSPQARDSVTRYPSPVVSNGSDAKESQINMANIQDTLYRDEQVSFVPFVGTNGQLSGNVINDYSFNVLGGYNLGVRKFELGGLFNLNRGDVGEVQISGLFNANGGNASGVQFAGYVNANRRKMEGVQIAGAINLNGEGANAPQIAGLLNANLKPSGGVQVAGLSNIQLGNYQGPQIAGILNVCAGRIEGGQIAGVVNYGKNVRGAQIGLINIADTIRGVPIGLVSVVRSGYHKIEVSADEIFYTNLAFRTGVRQFYTILAAGMKPDQFENVFWTVGYGFGTAPKLTRWLFLNFDLTANQLSQGSFTPAVNLLNKLYMGFDFQLAKNLSITTGITLNAYVTEKAYGEYPPLFTDYTPKLIYDEDVGTDAHLQMWWGARFGIRFL
jgi:hypothetical protein